MNRLGNCHPLRESFSVRGRDTPARVPSPRAACSLPLTLPAPRLTSTGAALWLRCSATTLSSREAMAEGVLFELKVTSTLPVNELAETWLIPSFSKSRNSSSFLSGSERYRSSTLYLALPGTDVCIAWTTVFFLPNDSSSNEL